MPTDRKIDIRTPGTALARWEKLGLNGRLVKHNTRTDQGMWVENPSINRTCDRTASTKRVPVGRDKEK